MCVCVCALLLLLCVCVCVCVCWSYQVLNEILDLRGSGMLDSAGLAYGALEGIERKVLPGWKEHGKTILSDRGLGEDALRMMGMKVPEMERLYQLIYAFSFGFAEMMRDTVFQRRHEDQGQLLLSVLDVHSTLLSEALDMTHHDLLGEMYAAKDREIADLRRDKTNLERRLQSVESEIAWAHEQARIAQEALEAAIKKANAEVAEANKRARDAERGQFEAEQAQAAAEALRDQALQEVRPRALHCRRSSSPSGVVGGRSDVILWARRRQRCAREWRRSRPKMPACLPDGRRKRGSARRKMPRRPKPLLRPLPPLPTCSTGSRSTLETTTSSMLGFSLVFVLAHRRLSTAFPLLFHLSIRRPSSAPFPCVPACMRVCLRAQTD